MNEPKQVVHVVGIQERPLVYAFKDDLQRLHDDRAAVFAWMREPDYVEDATLEWLMDWMNRRPLAAAVPL